jgi:hypothetical protein
MRPPMPKKPRMPMQKPPLNAGSVKAGAKGGAKSRLMTSKPPKAQLGPVKDYLP